MNFFITKTEENIYSYVYNSWITLYIFKKHLAYFLGEIFFGVRFDDDE